MEDTFHQTEAAVVANVLKRRCFEVEFPVLSHTEAFEALLNGTVDLLPSVWLPSGHASFLADAVPGQDYEVIGTTSEEGVFFWVVSAAMSPKIKSIDDFADPSKTEGMHPEICGPFPDAGLSKASIKITAELNARRKAVDPNAEELKFVPDMDAYVNFLENPPSDKFACGFWVPNWFNAAYRATGQVVRIDDGELGKVFGLPNRGVTVANGKFLRSGFLSSDDLAAVSRVFVGNQAINEMDVEMQKPNSSPMDIAADMMAKPENSYWFAPQANCFAPTV